MKKYRRTFNANLVHKDKSYSVIEVSELFNIHKGTVSSWIKEGLITIDRQKPYLITGFQLKKFICTRQNKRKMKCSIYEFYCCKCRQPRKSKDNSVWILKINEKQLTIKGECEVCGTKINKRNSVNNLIEIVKTFNIQTIEEKHLLGSNAPIVNTDKKKEIEYV